MPQNVKEKFRRIEPILVKPLMVIMSVRRIPVVLEAFGKLNFIDKVYFRNYTPAAISDVINDYLKVHFKPYTHIILMPDDITPTPLNIQRLIDDVRYYDFPVVGGYCNICKFSRFDADHCVICEFCQDNVAHILTNITFEPVDHKHLLSKASYQNLTLAYASSLSDIYPVWFHGMACGVINKETYKQIPLRSWWSGEKGLMQDLAYAVDCEKLGIQQFVDFRVAMRHYGTHHGRLLVGNEPTSIEFVEARSVEL